MLKQKCFYRANIIIYCIYFIIVCSLLLQSLPARAGKHVLHKKSGQNFIQDEIVARALEWVAAGVPYNRDVKQQYRFQNYRADCSGLVTMAWGIPATPPNYGLSTTTLSNVADLLGKAVDASGQPIIATMNQLQPGDILLNQGSAPHVILFVGWIDAVKKTVVTHPVRYTDGKYYYDGIEENFGANKAIEHLPTYPVDVSKFDYHQPWPFPYDPGYEPEDYYGWHFDLAKAVKFGYITGTSDTTTPKPSGEWMPPSPENGATLTANVLHLAATAYPAKKDDPAIQTVHFTLEANGVWTIICSLNKPTKSGSVYTCDVDLKQFKFPAGNMQTLRVSFDVVDKEQNVNLAPNGVHAVSYIPVGNTPTPTDTPTTVPAQTPVLVPTQIPTKVVTSTTSSAVLSAGFWSGNGNDAQDGQFPMAVRITNVDGKSFSGSVGMSTATFDGWVPMTGTITSSSSNSINLTFTDDSGNTYTATVSNKQINGYWSIKSKNSVYATFTLNEAA